ncbi:MAG: hypothetical protein R2813_05655 [Flavobacteriales bacterium]
MKRWLMHRAVVLISCSLTFFSAKTQTDSLGALQLLERFEIPREEKIEFFKPTSSAAPVIFSREGEALFIRPMDMATGQPIKTLTIRSNDTKKIDQYGLVGDSIFVLVRSIENHRTTGYEAVIYTLTGNELSQAHRHSIPLPIDEAKRNINDIFFTASKSGKHLAVVQQDLYDREKGATLFLEVTAFPNPQPKEFTLPLPFDADDLHVLGVSIDDSGAVYIGVTTGVKLNSPFLRKYLVYAFRPETRELHEFDLSRDKKYAQDMRLKTSGNNLNIVALFSEDPFAQGSTSGYIFVQLDSSGTCISDRKELYYPPSVKQELDPQLHSDGREITDVFIDNIHSIGGNSYAVMDRHYRDQVCTTDPRTGIITCTDQFHYEGILVENLNNPSESKFIGRSQLDYNKLGPFVGHDSYEVGSDLYVLYNDHQRNESTDAERIMNNPDRSNLRYVRINGNRLSSEHLVIEERNSFIYLPTVHGFVDGKTINALFSDGRNFRVGQVNTLKLR